MRSPARTGDEEKFPPTRFCHTSDPVGSSTQVTIPLSPHINSKFPFATEVGTYGACFSNLKATSGDVPGFKPWTVEHANVLEAWKQVYHADPPKDLSESFAK